MRAYINRIRRARLETRPVKEQADIIRLLKGLTGITVPPDTYARYERRNAMPLELLLPFCRITGAHIEDILNYDPASVAADKDLHLDEERMLRGRKRRTFKKADGSSRPPSIGRAATD
jgi:hypothetical protein